LPASEYWDYQLIQNYIYLSTTQKNQIITFLNSL